MRKVFFFILAFLTFMLGGHPAHAETPGVTDTEIKLGQSASFKGTSSALGTELWRGAETYFKYINDQGGVQGRKIRVTSLNDGYEGDTTLLNTINLIKHKNVFALFGYVGTPTLVKALPVIQKFSDQKIFLFSNFTGAQPQRERPHKKYVFNIRSSYRQETRGLVDNFVANGFRKFGVFIQNDAYGRSGAHGVERALKEHGLKVIAESTYERGTPFSKSMTERVDVLMDAGVEVVISIGSYAASAGFIRDARQAGFYGPIANVSFVGSDQLLQLLLQEEKRTHKKLTTHLVNSQVVPPWTDTSVPLVKMYQTLMDKYQLQVPDHLKDPDYVPSKYSFVSLEGFLNAKVFVEILKRSPKNLTRENFVETLEKTHDLDVGLKQNILFSKNKHQGLDNVFFTTIRNNQYVTIKKWPKAQ